MERPSREPFDRSCASGSLERQELTATARGLRLLRSALSASVACVLLVLCLPLFAGIALLILAVDGRPVIHKGRRLGLHKRPFTMYKFRTLVCGASDVIGSELFSVKHRVLIPFGMFLRDTRLDELPQLINIIRGEMEFFGPRPERPEVYASLCAPLDAYDLRFGVKPGLVGFSQLFTPHGTTKRLRKLFDNRAMQRPVYPFRDAWFVGCAALATLRTASARVLRYARDDIVRSRLLGLYREQRELKRVRPENTRVLFGEHRADGTEAALVDVNERALLIRCPSRLPDDKSPLQLRIEVKFRRSGRRPATQTRIVRLRGHVYQTRSVAGTWHHVVMYDALSAWGQYVMDQYLLYTSLCSPFSSRIAANGASRQPGASPRVPEAARSGSELGAQSGGSTRPVAVEE